MSHDPLQFDLNGIRVKREPRNHGQPQGTDFPIASGLAVCPFRVAVDSREQLPYEFSGMESVAGESLVVPTVVKGLVSGDYSINGLEDAIAIERKTLDDLYGSVTWGRDRFEREIERLNSYQAAFVVIEATWPEIMDPAAAFPGWVNRTEPRSVEGTIIAWSIRYLRVHWWACGGRREAEKRTFSILRKFWQEKGRKQSDE